MKRQSTICICAAAVAVALDLFAADATICVDTGKSRFPVAPDLWGIFFEDINLSLDGGVYAEMVRNRSFEDCNGNERDMALEYWHPIGLAEIVLDSSRPISKKNSHAVRVAGTKGSGIANEGYFGMGVRKGVACRISVAIRTAPGSKVRSVDVSLEAYSKPAIAKGRIEGVTEEWQTFELTLTPNDTDAQARLAFRLGDDGAIVMDCVSMFPSDAVAGIFRRDLVERLAALKPSFLRFPGGCWVEGNRMRDAYRWKDTIGDKWERRTQWNRWKYWATNGVGYHEFLELCELLGAKALFCINCGMSHSDKVPMDKMGEFVQDALDAIEYANGQTNSTWGAMRAANGHPRPFNLGYLEIGNENGGKAYEERYALIANAVRSRFPDVKLVFDNWKTTKRVEDPKDLRDDHFYSSPDDFMSRLAHEYDAQKGDFGIFVGEYAVIKGVGRYGSLRGAIGEAAFMLGLERNQDQVRLAAYAPLFANTQHMTWTPNLIYPTTLGNFVNPSWTVQKLFSENRGAEVLGVKVDSTTFETTAPPVYARRYTKHNIETIQASAVRCAEGAVTVKVVNCAETAKTTILNLKGNAMRTVFTGPSADAHNSPFAPNALKETVASVVLDGTPLTLPPLSLTIYKIQEKRP